MNNSLRMFMLIAVSQGMVVVAAPLVQKITNNTDFGYMIVHHSDDSLCSLRNKKIIIQPHSTFMHEFLLEYGQPSLVLRPVFYQNPTTKEDVWLTGNNFEFQSSLIDNVHTVWKKQKKSDYYRKDAQRWFDVWVGGDLSVIPHQVEMMGYLLDLSRITVSNKRHSNKQWLSYSKGIFSKLVLEFTIEQNRKNGLFGHISVLHGEGGVCSNGVVERLPIEPIHS